MGAVRAAVFAEAGVKLLADAQSAASFAVPSDAPFTVRGEALKIRLAGVAEVARLREVLHMEPTDG